MNKTVFLMDAAGNAVQWAAGMSLESHDTNLVAVMTRDASRSPIMGILSKDPRTCVSHFVRALCACPDGSLLEWDEAAGVVECKKWSAVTNAVSVDNPTVATPDPVNPVEPEGGAPEGWRELGDDEVIQRGDAVIGSGVFRDAPLWGNWPWFGKTVSAWREDFPKCPRGKAWRKVESPAPVVAPSPALLPDGRPVIPVPGHKKWRELYDDEVITEGDRVSARESFDFSVVADSTPHVGKHLRSYRLAGDEAKIPYGKAYRRIKPKKQKKSGGV